MKSDQFRELCRDASRLATTQPGKIGNLVLSKDERGESLIREPEMLYAFGRTIEGRPQPVPYGIEVPTIGLYRFTTKKGEKVRRALHDLVLFEGGARDVLIEFKKGQPGGKAAPAIAKDLQKLLREKAASGKVMFHICHAADSRTLRRLLDKYNDALTEARNAVAAHDLTHNDARWFAFYILALTDRKAKRAVLREKRVDSVSELLAKTPVFQLDDFKPVDL